MKSDWKLTRAYMSQLYRDAIAKRLETILADGTNTQSDKELAAYLTAHNCPCSTYVVSTTRREHGWGNKWARIKALKKAASDMVKRQPIEIG